MDETPGVRRADLFGVNVTATTYEEATSVVIAAAAERRSLGLSALAVHGLTMGARDERLRSAINRLDLVTPDGQPVRWALRLLHDIRLPDRVYGPKLAWRILAEADKRGIAVYLLGSTRETVEAYAASIRRRLPNLAIVGVQPDRFRPPTPQEDADDVAAINDSGAGIVLVGMGCPRQEWWVADHLGRVKAAMLAIGAAFDYGAGNLREPPEWIQRVGLHWLWRLAAEPRRLASRYLITNTQFLYLLARSWLRRKRP